MSIGEIDVTPGVAGTASEGDPATVLATAAPFGDTALRQFVKNRAAVFGLVILLFMIGLVLLGPMVYDTEPDVIVARPRQAPDRDHLMGIDYLGRDVLAGVIHGGRVTLLVGLVAGLASATIGIVIGAAAGYFGGWLDAVLSRVIEFFQVLPALLFAIVLAALWSPTTGIVIVAIALVTWTGTARIARAEFLRLRSMDYVRAARVMGASDRRIMTTMVLPNAMPPLIVSTTMLIGVAILFEASMSFLGLTDPNVISWGYAIGSSRPYVFETWWAVTYPGIAIFLTVLGVSLVGDGVNDAFNPKLRDR